MNLNKYQKLAKRTIPNKLQHDELLANAVLGLCGESGEVADLLKKNLFQGHEFDEEKLIDELGDVLWYIAEAATALKINLSEIAEHNIKKLEKRYPQGFSADKSINREESKPKDLCETCRYTVCNCKAEISDIEYNVNGNIIKCTEYNENK